MFITLTIAVTIQLTQQQHKSLLNIIIIVLIFADFSLGKKLINYHNNNNYYDMVILNIKQTTT